MVPRTLRNYYSVQCFLCFTNHVWHQLVPLCVILSMYSKPDSRHFHSALRRCTLACSTSSVTQRADFTTRLYEWNKRGMAVNQLARALLHRGGQLNHAASKLHSPSHRNGLSHGLGKLELCLRAPHGATVGKRDMPRIKRTHIGNTYGATRFWNVQLLAI